MSQVMTAHGATGLRRPTPFEWDDLRPQITLWWQQGAKRKDIRHFLAVWGFDATEKMILTRIQRWDLDRNNKEHEIAAAARLLRDRAAQGKTSVVTIRGRLVDARSIAAYARKKRVSVADLVRVAPREMPPAVQCRSPRPTPPLRAPDALRVPERFFQGAADYFASLFHTTYEGNLCLPEVRHQTLMARHDKSAAMLMAHLVEARELLQRGAFVLAGESMTDAMDMVPELLTCESFLLVPFLLVQAKKLIAAGFVQVAVQVIKHFYDFAVLRACDLQTPVRQFFKSCHRAALTDHFSEIIDLALRLCIIDVSSSNHSGPSRKICVVIEIPMISLRIRNYCYGCFAWF